MFCMAGPFFCSSGAQFHGKHGCSWNVIAQRATLQDFKSWRFLLFKEKMREGLRGTRMCFLLFRGKQGKAHAFLDFTLPEQVNEFVFSHRYIKMIVNAYVLKMWFHIDTHGAQKSRHPGCVSRKTWEHASCVLPHENTKMARELVCVSSSHHHRAWKRVCVKNVFLVFPLKLKSVAVFLAQAHPNRCFCQKLFTFRDQKLRKRHAAGKKELPKLTWQLQKMQNWTPFNAQKRYKRHNLIYKTYQLIITSS